MIKQTSTKVELVEVESLWLKSYSEVTYNKDSSLRTEARMIAITPDDEVPLRIFYRGGNSPETLELVSLLPKDWVEIKLLNYLGKDHPTNGYKTVMRNNNDGTVTTYKTDCWFAPGELVSSFDSIVIHDLKGKISFTPDKSKGYLMGWGVVV